VDGADSDPGSLALIPLVLIREVGPADRLVGRGRVSRVEQLPAGCMFSAESGRSLLCYATVRLVQPRGTERST
jgi:hypothetical protein